MKKILFLSLALLSLLSMKTDKPAYRLFDQNGKNASYKDLLKDASEADIVFFGELHDNPICHWLEYEITADLYAAKGKNLILGAEMFEADNQLIVNEYLGGMIKEKDFESQARLWPNYKTDYKRLLNFARDSSLRFIATNIPRRYAAMVNKSGFEVLNKLDKRALQFIAPIPIQYDSTLACYADIRFAIADAKLTTSHGKLGLPAEYGLSWLLPRLIGVSRANDMLLSSRVVLASEGERMGLVNAVFETADDMLAHANGYARMLATQVAPSSLRATKRQIYEDLHGDVGASVRESETLLNRLMTEPDFREGVRAFVEKRPPEF